MAGYGYDHMDRSSYYGYKDEDKDEDDNDEVRIVNLGTSQFYEGGTVACTSICLFWARYLLNNKGTHGVLKSELVKTLREACKYWREKAGRKTQMMSTALQTHTHLNLVESQEEFHRPPTSYYNYKTGIRQWIDRVKVRRRNNPEFVFCDEVLVIVVDHLPERVQSVAYTYLLAIYGFSLAFFDSHDGIHVTFYNLSSLFNFLDRRYRMSASDCIIDFHWLRSKPASLVTSSSTVMSPLSTSSSSSRRIPASYYHFDSSFL